MSGVRSLGLSRRAFAALLLQATAAWGGRALAQDPASADRGLGGTGAAPVDPAETLGQDRGIGGTGVIGTIRRFGSIVVNDLRVTFPADVKVSIDGRPARFADLKVGHVVRVLARHRAGTLATRAIVARSEVVGPVESHDERGFTVLGQRVEPGEGVTLPRHRVGAFVAVSGLRRIDGAIVASLVEPRPAGVARLHGPVEAGPDGVPTIGGMPVEGLPPASFGRRVSLTGARRGAAFRAASVAVEPAMPFAGADRLSVEAYVARAPDGLWLGSGFDVATDAATRDAVAEDAAVRAVVMVRPGPAGRLDAESLRIETPSRRSNKGGERGIGAPGGPAKPGTPTGPVSPAGPGASGGAGPPGGPEGARGGGPAGARGGPAGGGPAGGHGGGPGR